MPAQQVLRIFFKLFPPLAFAVQSDSVRRPIRLPFSVYHATASLMRGKHEHLGYLHVFRS